MGENEDISERNAATVLAGRRQRAEVRPRLMVSERSVAK